MPDLETKIFAGFLRHAPMCNWRVARCLFISAASGDGGALARTQRAIVSNHIVLG